MHAKKKKKKKKKRDINTVYLFFDYYIVANVHLLFLQKFFFLNYVVNFLITLNLVLLDRDI